MSRTLPRPTPARLVLAAATALLLVVGLSALLPDRQRGERPDRDGSIATVTEQYVATTAAPRAGRVTAAARAEIERVLAGAPDPAALRATDVVPAPDLLRCAEFEGQRYCLGRGWTDAPASGPATTAARTVTRDAETTGDLTTADLLAQRSAMDPAELAAVERAELVAAARSVAKVVLLRHQLLGEPLPAGFLERHPEARAGTAETSTVQAAARPKRMRDYPGRSTVLRPARTREQVRTYWCGPATMQMIAWGWQRDARRQRYWARRLGTTTSGSSISAMVRVVNRATGFDRADRAGRYVVLDISDWGFRQWMLLQMRHVEDYRAPLVLHPILLKRFYPYLDDDASGHFQVGRGYAKNGRRPDELGYFEPWNQRRFDPSEPTIRRVQWRNAYKSYRANQAHPQQNIGV